MTEHRETAKQSTAPPQARTFGTLLREAAGRWPEQPAIIAHGRRWSFSELDHEVDAWACGLIALGIGHGDSVGILSGNRPEWLLAACAAARIGAIAAPMNTWYKADELKYGLDHAEVKLLVTAGSLHKQDFAGMLLGLCPSLAKPRSGGLTDPGLPHLRHVVTIDPNAGIPGALSIDDLLGGGSSLPQEELRAAEDRVESDDLLFLLYTSGSTGQPKAVMIQHGATIVNDFEIGERLHLTPEDRLWIAIPLFYAFASVNALPAAWTHGAALILQESFDPEEALRLIEEQAATIYYGLGNMTRALLSASSFPLRDVSSLSRGLTGYSREDKRVAIEDLGVSGCCSIYGLTETHGLAAMTDTEDALEDRLGTDGRLLPGWDARVVDPASGQPLNPGAVGHLLLRGPLTAGYYKDPEQTAEVFTEDGFFRTGDLVAVDERGFLHFHSRMKDVIKVGGINVSPLEVENILQRHSDIVQAHVVAVPDEARGESIVAFVEAEPSRSLTEQAVKDYVKEGAANFKIPAHVLFRSEHELPRLASGKIAKGVLRQQAIDALGIEN